MLLVEDFTDFFVKDAQTRGEHFQALLALRPRSGMVVPLKARGQVQGVLYFLVTDPGSGRQYGYEDLALAQELAYRGAVAIDNARLYAAERHLRRSAEQANERTAQLQAITSALSEALTPARVVDVILEQGIAATGARAGVIVRLLDDLATLAVLGSSGYTREQVKTWQRIPLSTPVPLAEAARTPGRPHARAVTPRVPATFGIGTLEARVSPRAVAHSAHACHVESSPLAPRRPADPRRPPRRPPRPGPHGRAAGPRAPPPGSGALLPPPGADRAWLLRAQASKLAPRLLRWRL